MAITITLPPMDEDQDYWLIGDEHGDVFYRVNARGVVEHIETEQVEELGELIIPITNWTNH